MWCDHPFSQRSKTTKRAVGVGVRCDMEGGGFDEILKNRGGAGGGGGVGPLCQLCYRSY